MYVQTDNTYLIQLIEQNKLLMEKVCGLEKNINDLAEKQETLMGDTSAIKKAFKGRKYSNAKKPSKAEKIESLSVSILKRGKKMV